MAGNPSDPPAAEPFQFTEEEDRKTISYFTQQDVNSLFLRFSSQPQNIAFIRRFAESKPALNRIYLFNLPRAVECRQLSEFYGHLGGIRQIHMRVIPRGPLDSCTTVSFSSYTDAFLAAREPIAYIAGSRVLVVGHAAPGVVLHRVPGDIDLGTLRHYFGGFGHVVAASKFLWRSHPSVLILFRDKRVEEFLLNNPYHSADGHDVVCSPLWSLYREPAGLEFPFRGHSSFDSHVDVHHLGQHD